MEKKGEKDGKYMKREGTRHGCKIRRERRGRSDNMEARE